MAAAKGVALPELARNRALATPEAVVMREKTLGVWREWRWAQAWDRVGALAVALASLGVGKGDKVAIIGHNRPDLYWVALAAQVLGAASAALWTQMDAEDARQAWQALDGPKVAVVGDTIQQEAIEAMHAHTPLPGLAVIAGMGSAPAHAPAAGVRREDLAALADAASAEAKTASLSAMDSDADATALYIMRAGRSGAPQAAALTHRNLVVAAQALTAAEAIADTDELVAMAPMAWAGDPLFSLATPCVSGAKVSCPETSLATPDAIHEIAPTCVFAPSRAWRVLSLTARLRLTKAAAFKQRWAAWAFAEGAKRHGRGAARPSMGDRLRAGLADWLALVSMRDNLGLDRVRVAYSLGSSRPSTLAFFHAMRVPLRQAYGLAETAGLAAVESSPQTPSAPGRLVAGMEARVDDAQTLWLRGPGVSASGADSDGWLETGDAADLAGETIAVLYGHRDSRLSALAGSPFAATLERVARDLDMAREVMAFPRAGGEGVVLVMAVEEEAVRAWADDQPFAWPSYDALLTMPEMLAKVAGDLALANRALPEAQQARGLVVAPRDFGTHGETTLSGFTLRREVVARRFAPVLEALAQGKDGVVALADGAKAACARLAAA